MARVAIIGAGAFGTALATVARSAGHEAVIRAREPEVVASIRDAHENTLFLPGVPLDPTIGATTELAEALDGADLVLLVAPAQHARATCEAVAPLLPPGVPVVMCAKGIEVASGALMSDVLTEALPGVPAAVLSGPMFAREVASGLPAAATVASHDAEVAARVVELLGTTRFRPYRSDDVVGVELGGAVKNVIAIAAGVAIGGAYGESARAGLITRGLAEMVRLGVAMGARTSTLTGLSGLGDLALTCGSTQSRNMSLGVALGQGQSAADVLSGRLAVTEGVPTARVVVELAARYGVEMPICQAVHDVLHAAMPLEEAIERLLARALRAEAESQEG